MEELKTISSNSQVFIPSDDFVKQANLKQDEYNKLKQKAENNYLEFWSDLAIDKITWNTEFRKILNEECKIACSIIFESTSRCKKLTAFVNVSTGFICMSS